MSKSKVDEDNGQHETQHCAAVANNVTRPGCCCVSRSGNKRCSCLVVTISYRIHVFSSCTDPVCLVVVWSYALVEMNSRAGQVPPAGHECHWQDCNSVLTVPRLTLKCFVSS
jgi:hypothetical protein